MANKKDDFIKRVQRRLQQGSKTENGKQAFAWFQKQIGNTRKKKYDNPLENKKAPKDAADFLIGRDLYSTFKVGGMMFFQYDPKHKDTLPYYDIFPLVIPINIYKDGFLGLNLHYLPPPHRAKLLNALMNLATDSRFDEKTRLAISYEYLAGVKKYKLAGPCIKRYLTNHIRSKFVLIPAPEWEQAIFLPFAIWAKASEAKVWDDSLKKLL